MLPPSRIFLFTSLFLSSISAAVIGQQPSATEQQDAEVQSDLKTFQKLLEHVDPSALHAALHDFSEGKFKHGVFPEDRTAVEAVHRDNAPLATSIVSLARRQDSNSSIPVATVTSVVTVVETTSTSVIVVVPTSGIPASPSAPSTAVTPSTPVPPPSSTTLGVPPASSTVVVAITSTVPVIASTTTVVSPVSVGPGPVSLSKTLLTTTNARGVTIVSTVNGGVVTLSLSSQSAGSAAGATTTAAAPSSITTVVFQTTTLPNGAQSTITAVTIIQASESAIITPSGIAGVGGSGTSTATPGLQSGLAPQSRAWPWELVGALGGAIGVAMIL